MPHPKNKQDKNINPNISRQASHRHPEHTTSHRLAHQRGINSLPPTGVQTPVPPNTKATQTSGPTSHTRAETRKENHDPTAWRNFLGSCTGSGAVTPCLSPPACAVRVFPGRPGLLHGPLWRRRTMLRVGLPWPGLLLCVFLGGCSSISVWRVKLGGSL